MITIQHNETGKNGIFEAWMQSTEKGACTEPVQVGEMTYQRPSPLRSLPPLPAPLLSALSKKSLSLSSDHWAHEVIVELVASWEV